MIHPAAAQQTAYRHAVPRPSDFSAGAERPDLFPYDLLRFAILAANTPHPALLYGETGSGKTHLARLIHQLGPRSEKPFIRVNCASIPESLFESEMFGHVRGAFTDAREARPGLFEAAHGGTLFLDEFGELPLSVQPKLLSVLEEGRVRRLGASRETPVDVRVVAATNRDLHQMMAAREFREDLYFRCAVLECRVPPLRECTQRIPELAADMLARVCAPGAAPRIAADALRVLCAYAWPGNLRELDNVLRQAATYAEDGCIRAHHLPQRVRDRHTPWLAQQAPAAATRKPRYRGPEDPEREIGMIVDALRAEDGNRTRAAGRMGMSRAAFWIKLQRYAAPLLERGIDVSNPRLDGVSGAPGGPAGLMASLVTG